MYILELNRKAASDFVNGPLWKDLKRCLEARKPESADVKDEPHVAAAKGFRRAAWDETIAMIEKLPFEFEKGPASPMDRPAVTITDD